MRDDKYMSGRAGRQNTGRGTRTVTTCHDSPQRIQGTMMHYVNFSVAAIIPSPQNSHLIVA